MVDFAQKIGQLGQAGDEGHSVLLVPPQWKPATVNQNKCPIGAAEAAMQQYISTSRCQMKKLSWFLNKDSHGCELNMLICDNCKRTEESLAETSIFGDTDSEKEASKSEKNHLVDMITGEELVHLQMQEHAKQLENYITALNTWQGICIICYHLSSFRSSQSLHA